MSLYPYNEDFIHPMGYTNALFDVMRVKPGGLCWMSLLWSALTWAGRKETGRSIRSPEGAVWKKKVFEANLMVNLSVVMILILWLRGVYCVIDNPVGLSSGCGGMPMYF